MTIIRSIIDWAERNPGLMWLGVVAVLVLVGVNAGPWLWEKWRGRKAVLSSDTKPPKGCSEWAAQVVKLAPSRDAKFCMDCILAGLTPFQIVQRDRDEVVK